MLGPLIRTPGRPQGGWNAVIPIKGQSVRVEGRTAVEAFNAAVLALSRNGVSSNTPSVWLNLNLQWMSRTPSKYHIARPSDLMIVARAKDPEPVEQDKRRRLYKPQDWGASAWNWLNLFLAREEYHYRDFLTQLEYVLDLLNPAANPEIGCAECHKDTLLEVDKVKNRPGMTRQEAREWLVAFHNKVSRKIGKQVLTFDAAAKKAFWT